MIKISDAVEKIVQDTAFYEEGLAKELLNITGVAREIHAKVEALTMKSVKVGAIVMALKRLGDELKKNKQIARTSHLKLGEQIVRSSLFEMTYGNSPTLENKLRKVLEKVEESKESFICFTKGMFETTIIASDSIRKILQSEFVDEKELMHLSNLSSISIRYKQEILKIPGTYYKILKMLAWHGVNVIEIIPTYTEITIIFENADIERAFSILRTLS